MGKKFPKQIRKDKDFDWEVFLKYVNILYDKFPQTLKTSYPNLTEMQIRICCLSILKIKDKKIAYFFKLSNVDSIRYRKREIRKELKMTENSNFTNQLLEIFKDLRK
jgi:hypothetical protein